MRNYNENRAQAGIREVNPVPVPEPSPAPVLAGESDAVNAECLRDYEINIKFLNRGCIVNVGCKAIAFESVDSAMLEINNYVSNPYETQKKWRKIIG